MNTIALPSRCDRAAAEALLPELQAALGSGQLTSDGSAAVQVGQAMLQLLVSARFSGVGIAITASPQLREAAELVGLASTLIDTSDTAQSATQISGSA